MATELSDLAEIDFLSLAENVRKIRLMPQSEKEAILARADEEIREKHSQASRLVRDLCYDRSFCAAAGIDYNNITSSDSRDIKTAIATAYLLPR